MSIDLVAAALWLPLEPARKLVLVALCDRADHVTGKCWPGREEISIRSSVSMTTVTKHLQALEKEGWVKSRRGNARRGETTTRWVAAKRIREEAEEAKAAYYKRIEERLDQDSYPDPLQLALGEVDDGSDQVETRSGEVDDIDQVKLTHGSGEAASLITVIEPSLEPSDQNHHRARGSDDERTDTAGHVDAGAVSTPPSGSLDGLMDFGRRLPIAIRNERLLEQFAENVEVDVDASGVRVELKASDAFMLFLRRQPGFSRLQAMIAGCAMDAGFPQGAQFVT